MLLGLTVKAALDEITRHKLALIATGQGVATSIITTTEHQALSALPTISICIGIVSGLFVIVKTGIEIAKQLRDWNK